jgi:DNA polymerase-3 subunit gamma/tau
MGGRDMQYAPDPKVGFEMTIIRLLDFEPAYEGADTTPPGSGGNGSVAVNEDSGDRQQPSKKQPKPKVADTKAMDPASKAGGQAPLNGAPWHERIEEIPATGVTAMILEHSNLITLTEDRIELLLDESHDTLYNDTQQGHLEELFAERIGKPVEVVVTTGTVVEETPAVRKQRLAQERLDLAESALRKDENVRSLMSEFDGRLDAVQPRSD